MKRLLTIIILLAACACDDLAEAGDDGATEGDGDELDLNFEAPPGVSWAPDPTVCVDHESGECWVDVQGLAECGAHEWDACAAAWQPRACIWEHTGVCFVIPEGDWCPMGSLLACK